MVSWHNAIYYRSIFLKGLKKPPKNFTRYSQYLLSKANRTRSKHVSEILPSDSARSSWSVIFKQLVKTCVGVYGFRAFIFMIKTTVSNGPYCEKQHTTQLCHAHFSTIHINIIFQSNLR
jgi:hypothetical protein